MEIETDFEWRCWFLQTRNKGASSRGWRRQSVNTQTTRLRRVNTAHYKRRNHEKQIIPRRGVYTGGDYDRGGHHRAAGRDRDPELCACPFAGATNGVHQQPETNRRAKQQWALEFRGGAAATPTPDNLRPFLGRGAGTLPSCPADSAASFVTSYGINDLQTAPICLVSPGGEGEVMGHRLPN